MTLLLVAPAIGAAWQHEHRPPPSQPAVDVSFSTSCAPKVARMFDGGVAFLHTFAFDQAIDTFRLVQHADVDCAIAWWGTAMAQWGRWNTTGTDSALQAGREALAAAREARRASDRERQYLAAVAGLYEIGGRDRSARDRYRDAMRRLALAFPDDVDAVTFAALAEWQAGGTPAERAQRATSLLEQVDGRSSHPGLRHYLLLAGSAGQQNGRTREAARTMTAAASDDAYALHLPSHVWIRDGLWPDAIEANLRATDAARRAGSHTDELHALDALVYALLQVAGDVEARTIRERLAGFSVGPEATGSAQEDARFALVAIPARIALESGDWLRATQLQATDGMPPWATTLTSLVRAVGYARLARPAEARRQLAQHGSATGSLPPGHPAESLDGLRAIAEAWTLHAESSGEAAVRVLQNAARAETKRGVSDLAHGPLLPSEEALGELLLLMDRPGEAGAAFDRALASSPRRLRSLFGAGVAASRLGQQDAAKRHFTQLSEQCSAASDPVRREVLRARQWLAGSSAHSGHGDTRLSGRNSG